jgi:hypothetical protein
MDYQVSNNINLENATLIFKNFSGRVSEYNKDGSRSFGVLIDNDLAGRLENDGWRVKYLRPREDDPDDHRQAWLPVKVKFNNYPPSITLINSRGKKRLDEGTVEQLDWSRFKKCDLVIRPYNYPEIAGRPAGVAAYLKAMYVTLDEDEFEMRYNDIPDIF